MKSVLLIFASVALVVSGLRAEVVRPSPEFRWVDGSGAAKSSKDFRGRPIVVIFATSPRQWAFRSQVGQLQQMYERLAADKVVCVAVFTQEPGLVRSNIPFVTVSDGPGTAYAFQVERNFGIAVIGRDGNLDYYSNRVTPVQKIYDVMNNSFVVQQNMRRP